MSHAVNASLLSRSMIVRFPDNLHCEEGTVACKAVSLQVFVVILVQDLSVPRDMYS